MTKDTKKISIHRPPVVTIFGHVDHGKTSLLDKIRQTNIAGKEFGGITQHIGAYQVEIPSNKSGNKQKITFIDTPGHEAFVKMRSRGAEVADIGILVISASDGVMPQTEESLTFIKDAKIPYIVAINKIDLPGVNIDKVKKQLVRLGIELEEYGGETPVINISAKTGEGISQLLNTIILLADLFQPKDIQEKTLKAIVIESSLSKNKGPISTVIIRQGNLKVGEDILCENQEFRIRAINNWVGQQLMEISAGDPGEILGWKTIPSVGSILFKKNESMIIKEEKKPLAPISLKTITQTLSSDSKDKIKLILKADAFGSLEALTSILKKNNNIAIIASGIGGITESDIFMAKTSSSIVVGFNTKVSDNITKLADSEKVIVKTYNIIYKLTEEIDEVAQAIKEGNLVKVLGEAKVIAIFNIKDQTVAGIKVISGRIARGDQIKIVRENKEIGRVKIKSLRHGKEDINSTGIGTEAGLITSQDIAILTGDSIIAIG